MEDGQNYPKMYRFFMDEFQRHLAKAEAARMENDILTSIDEIKQMNAVIAELKILIQEFRSTPTPSQIEQSAKPSIVIADIHNPEV